MGTLRVVDCRQGLIEIRNAMVQGTPRFRQVRAAECVIGLINEYVLEGSLPALI